MDVLLPALYTPYSAAGNFRANNRNAVVGNFRANKRNIAVQRRLMAVNKQIFQRQKRRQQANVNRQLQQPRQRRFNNNNRQISVQPLRNNQQQFGDRRNQFNGAGQRRFNQGNRMNNQRGFGGRQVQVGRRGPAQLTVRANNNAQSQRYQQYIQQARALIRAQRERPNNSIYVDAPANGFNRRGRGGGRGRFRR